MRLVLQIAGATIEITPLNSDGEHPYLIAPGTLRIAARAGRLSGLGVGESPNFDILLDNNERLTAPLLRYPLRVLGSFYDSANVLFFAGAVANITYGRTMTLTLKN